MSLTRRDAFAVLWALSAGAAQARPPVSADHDARSTTRLIFDRPARRWIEALPIGAGSVGAMVYGGGRTEKIQLNHHDLWSGRPAPEDDRASSREALADVRRLLFAGRYAEANKLAQAQMSPPMNAESYGSYQTLADLVLTFDAQGPVTDYVRELDLAQGLVRVVYTQGGARHRRTLFASHPDQAVVVRLETDAPVGLSLTALLSREAEATVEVADGLLRLTGRPKPFGTTFAAFMGCRTEGGQARLGPEGWRVDAARAVVLTLTAATDLLTPDPEPRALAAANAVAGRSWESLRARHAADHHRLFDAVRLTLDAPPAPSASTDRQVAAVRAGGEDAALAETYFNFGRYLLIASSRAGSLPANLQGLWAEGLHPPWSADYHLNINIQMNYWPAEPCGLADLQEPFFAYLERLRPHAERNAQVAYGCGGAVAHYTSNPWGHVAADGDLSWGLWPEGLAWAALHFWERYAYGGDRRFLAERAYPMLKAVASFSLDYLTPDPRTGRLVAGPSTSPENFYIAPDGFQGAITMGPAMSQSITRAVLERTRDAARTLGADEAFARRCQAALDRLQGLRIGADGRIMEWPEPFGEVEPGHRHISHLFGLFPGDEIDVDDTPALAAAARRTLEARLSHGGGYTGWSAVWIALFWARLGDGEAAHGALKKLFREATADNLLDTQGEGAGVIFQIDANLGAVAAMTEMLLQSQRGRLRFLPALPKAWGSGRITGLRARGGVQADLVWRDGRMAQATLRPARDGAWRLVAPPGQALAQATEDGRVFAAENVVPLKAGRAYVLRFD